MPPGQISKIGPSRIIISILIRSVPAHGREPLGLKLTAVPL
jgi:hypothetical protein